MKKLQNTRKVAVVTPSGEKLEERELHNIALDVLFPGEPVVIIDWFASGHPPTAADLDKPVPAEGNLFYGNMGWGSAVKRGQTIGLRSDLLARCGLLKNAERAIMTGRTLLGQGLFGGLEGSFKVMVVPAGTIINGNPVDDGHSLIRRDLAKMGRSDLDLIELGEGKQNYSFWQRIPWGPELEAELKPIIDSDLIDCSDPATWDIQEGPMWDERQELMQLESKMVLHPYVAQALGRSSAEYFARLATTVRIPTLVRVAVPTTTPKIAAQGKYSVTRYPVDSNGSTQAVSVRAKKAEMERIANLEVIQYTIACKSLMAKGCFGIVDELPEDVDIVLCVDDIKMGCNSLDVREFKGAVLFNQWFAAGSAIGVNGKWASKRMGLDFDGDMVFVSDLSELPILYRTIEGRIQGETPKLEKSNSPLGARSKMVVNSMRNIVGFASNVAAATFCVADRETLARNMGYAGETELNDRLNWYIKVGTDGFKTMVDLEAVHEQLKRLQSKLIRLLNRSAPWCHWPNSWAFTRGIPSFYHEGMNENEKANCIPVFYDGTIAQICRLTLPSMKAGINIKMCPLSEYRGWATRPHPEILKSAHELQLEFNARVHRVNFSWSDQVINFKAWWRAATKAWADNLGLTDRAACAALWHEAHSPRSEHASGASVFLAYPDEVREIVANKPGLVTHKFQTLVLGLEYVFDPVPDQIRGRVEIREIKQVRENKTLIRKGVCGLLPGKKDAGKAYPRDLIGMIEIHADQPELGAYWGEFTRAGHGKAWHLELSPA